MLPASTALFALISIKLGSVRLKLKSPTRSNKYNRIPMHTRRLPQLGLIFQIFILTSQFIETRPNGDELGLGKKRSPAASATGLHFTLTSYET